MTVCIAGSYVRNEKENSSRCALLGRIVDEIRDRRWRPDVVLFPGGFFFIDDHLGHLPDDQRRARLARHRFSVASQEAAAKVGALVVVGVDGNRWTRPGERVADLGDQLCVAWNSSGIVGIGRKIFPVAGDEADDYVVYRSDFGSRMRLVPVNPGQEALLCSCYDMFGCSESSSELGPRAQNIGWLGNGRTELLDRRTNRAVLLASLREDLGSWERLVRSATLGLVAIHGFTRNGEGSGKGYWQRHGIERASQVIGGRTAVGAAHFEGPLPQHDVAVLAAAGDRPIRPVDHFYVETQALVRRFEFPVSSQEHIVSEHQRNGSGRLLADEGRGREVGRILHEAFATPGIGIFGVTEMPEDILPKGVARGSREHLLFITLTVAIDYQRDAHELWEAARATYENPATRYVFFPEQLHERPQPVLVNGLRNHGLSRKHDRDAGFWRTVATSFLKKWAGDPRRLLETCRYEAPAILARLVQDSHLEADEEKRDFPSLRGPKIAPLWVRMLRDNVGLPIKRMEEVPIPVDVHIARATFSLGVLKGTLRASFSEIVVPVQKVWATAAQGTEYIALDYDEPLWHLSKFGCSRRHEEECPRANECPVAAYCVVGKVKLTGSTVDLAT